MYSWLFWAVLFKTTYKHNLGKRKLRKRGILCLNTVAMFEESVCLSVCQLLVTARQCGGNVCCQTPLGFCCLSGIQGKVQFWLPTEWQKFRINFFSPVFSVIQIWSLECKHALLPILYELKVVVQVVESVVR